MTGRITMREYARRQLAQLLRKLMFELHRSPTAPDGEAVHDLRVAVRRFLQVARAFRQFLPVRELKRIRKRLRRVLDLAAEVRERDIALEFFDAAGVAAGAAPRARMIGERRKAQRRLAASLKKWNRKDLGVKWRSALELADENRT